MIYKCKGENCKEKASCWRYNVPSSKGQIFIERQSGINGECKYYFKWEMRL